MSKAVLKPLIKREKTVKKEKRNILKQIPLKKMKPLSLIKCICAFLLSGTHLIGGVTPLGFSFFTAVFGGNDTYFCGAAAILGIIFSGGGLLTVGKYLIATILFSLIYERFLPARAKTNGVSAIFSSLSVLFSGVFLQFATVTVGGFPLIYDFVILVVESASVWIASMAFIYAIPLISSLHIRRALTSEETVAIAFLIGGIICSFGNIEISGVFSLTGTLCVLFVLCFASRFGSMHGCCAGVIMGTICCLSRGRIDACVASFAISGLCSGYFSKYGRWATCISFIMSNAIVTILSNGSTETLINILDTFVAVTVLYCMPKKVFDAINIIGSISHPSSELAASHLNSASAAVKQCENSFKKIFELRSANDTNKMILYSRTAYKVCSGCGLRKYCWGRDGKSTREAMDKLADALHNGLPIAAENAPNHCLRKEQFLGEFKRMYDVYKNDCIWTSKIAEFQASVCLGFNSIAELIDDATKKILSSQKYDNVASDDIKCRLRREGINTKSVLVTGNGDETQVRISFESCGGFGRCENAVYKILEESSGVSFIRTGLRNCGECSCLYVVKPSFSISAAVASAIKASKKASGDYAIYALVDRHTYAIILCDGMGSGETARAESRTSASLLMKLLEVGLSPQNAINIINSMLLCSSSGTIAAMDLCLINLDDGSSHLYKCGGAVTFAKTNGDVKYIDNTSLPIGTASPGDAQIISIPSQKGSMLVLVSDGIISSENESKPWIKNTICDYKGNDPDKLARLILERAKKSYGELVKDDITVVAAYIG